MKPYVLVIVSIFILMFAGIVYLMNKDRHQLPPCREGNETGIYSKSLGKVEIDFEVCSIFELYEKQRSDCSYGENINCCVAEVGNNGVLFSRKRLDIITKCPGKK